MINTSIGLIGLALQSAKGTAASTPEYVHGLTGGQVFKLDLVMASVTVLCVLAALMYYAVAFLEKKVRS